MWAQIGLLLAAFILFNLWWALESYRDRYYVHSLALLVLAAVNIYSLTQFLQVV